MRLIGFPRAAEAVYSAPLNAGWTAVEIEAREWFRTTLGWNGPIVGREVLGWDGNLALEFRAARGPDIEC